MVTNAAGLLAAIVAGQPAEGDRPSGFYVTVAGGAAIQNDADLHTLTGSPLDATLDYDLGGSLDVGVGYTWAMPTVSLSVQLDYSFETAAIASVSSAGPSSSADGSNTSHTVTLSGLAEVYISDRFALYAGGGVGGTLTQADLELNLGGPVITFPAEESFDLSWRVTAGVQYALNERLVIYGGVTYFDAGLVEFDAFSADNSSLRVSVGLRLYF